MDIPRTTPRVAFVLLAAFSCPCLSVWGADGADSPSPTSPEEKQALIRKYIAAHASEDPKVREEAQQALVKVGSDAAEELVKSIERSDIVQGRLQETLRLIRDLELTPVQQITLAILRKTRVTLDFQNQPLREVVEYLQMFANLNLTHTAGVKGDALITLKVQNLPLENALNLIYEQVGAVWYMDDHAIVIAPEKDVEPRRLFWIRKYLDKRLNPKDPEVLLIQNKLDKLKIELDFVEAGLEDVVEFIRQFSGISMVIAPAVRTDEAIMGKKVTIKVRNMVLSECIKTLLSSYGLTYSIRDCVIYISRQPVKTK